MTREEAIEYLENAKVKIDIPKAAVGARKTNEALDMAIKALEQEPCEDAISRSHALSEFKRLYFDNDTVVRCAELILGSEPSVQPKQKTGHWIRLDECANEGMYCSKCQKKVVKLGWSETVKQIKYCPNCGAKMEG